MGCINTGLSNSITEAELRINEVNIYGTRDLNHRHGHVFIKSILTNCLYGLTPSEIAYKNQKGNVKCEIIMLFINIAIKKNDRILNWMKIFPGFPVIIAILYLECQIYFYHGP